MNEDSGREETKQIVLECVLDARVIYEKAGLSPMSGREDHLDRPGLDILKTIIEQLVEVRLTPPALELREPVKWFAELMEQTLRANDHKGGWQNDSMEGLLLRLREETRELESVCSPVVGGHVATQLEAIAKEAADVANFAMMIADNAMRSIRAARVD